MSAPHWSPVQTRALVACAIAVGLAVTAQATTPALTAIHSATAVSGKFLFTLPDGALVVLDASTGNQLFRGQPRDGEVYGQDSFVGTPYGVVVRSYRRREGQRPDNVYRLLNRRTQAVVWEVASEPPCHVGEDYLICPDARHRLSTRHLRDGRVLWSYAPESEIGEVLDSKGRVLVAGQDEERSLRVRPDGSKLLSSRHRVRSLSLLDGRTGKEIVALRGLAIDVADVAYGTRPMAFDGSRVVIDVRPADGSCTTRLVRVFTVNAESNTFVSEEKCVAARPAPAPEADYQSLARKISIRHFLAAVDGRLLVEEPAMGIGILNCIDARSGRPLWQYTFFK